MSCRDERVDRRVKEDERGADLVERARDVGADLGGPPQDCQLLPQAIIERPGGSHWKPRVVSCLENPRHSAEGHQGRSTSSLGGVGGQDRMDAQTTDGSLRGVDIRRKSPGLPERLDDPGERVVRSPRLGAAASLLKNPHTMTLLGEVGQPEMQQKGSNDDFRVGVVEAVELPFQRVAGFRITRPCAHRATTRPGDETAKVDPGLLLDDLAQQAPQAFDFEPERIGSTHAAA